MSDSHKTTPDSNTTEAEQNQNSATQEPVARSPRYVWPLFWAFFLLLALLIVFAWIVWRERQVQELQLEKDNVVVLEIQKKNSALEAEIVALDKLLAYDPCRILELLQNAQAHEGLLEGLTKPIVLTSPIVYVGDEKVAQIQAEQAKAEQEKAEQAKAEQAKAAQEKAEQEVLSTKPALNPSNVNKKSEGIGDTNTKPTPGDDAKPAPTPAQPTSATPTKTPPIIYVGEEPAPPPPPPLPNTQEGGK